MSNKFYSPSRRETPWIGLDDCTPMQSFIVNVNHFFMWYGKQIFMFFGNEFLHHCGKQIFMSGGKHFFI